VATTFVGDDAPTRAQELVLELRKRYKLTAYWHRERFDFTKGPSASRAQKVRYRNNQLEEVAVLVGDFPSIDDPEAQNTLRMLKTCRPHCMDLQSGEKDARPMADFRSMLWSATPKTDPKSKSKYGTAVNNKKYLGPMANAMLTTNPLLPDEYFVPKGVDRFVLDMNRDVKHSLLDNPGRYTVKVATFTGASVIDQAKIKAIQKGSEAPSRLAEAAEKAHKLTETLRSQGYEAYEFHDRGQSYVTVGSFNAIGTPREGKVEVDPKIQTIITTFGSGTTPTPSVANGISAGKPRIFGGIPTDLYPTVVEVPRKSISGDYAERRFFSRR